MDNVVAPGYLSHPSAGPLLTPAQMAQLAQNDIATVLGVIDDADTLAGIELATQPLPTFMSGAVEMGNRISTP
eukprot:3097848-Rhodomonas_salina.1